MITLGAKEAQQAKDNGIALAASHRTKVLALARSIAFDLAAKNGGVTNAEDVAIQLEKMGIDSTQLGNAAGAIFRTKNWKFTGQFVTPVRLSRHGNQIRVWQYLA